MKMWKRPLFWAGFAIGWLACWVVPFLISFPRAWRGKEHPRYAYLIISELDVFRLTFGKYPDGSNVEIGRALNGQNPSNLVLLRPSAVMNDKREIIDPWGTPYRIYFSPVYGALLWSAGGNRKFDRGNDQFFGIGNAPTNNPFFVESGSVASNNAVEPTRAPEGARGSP